MSGWFSNFFGSRSTDPEAAIKSAQEKVVAAQAKKTAADKEVADAEAELASAQQTKAAAGLVNSSDGVATVGGRRKKTRRHRSKKGRTGRKSNRS